MKTYKDFMDRLKFEIDSAETEEELLDLEAKIIVFLDTVISRLETRLEKGNVFQKKAKEMEN